MCPNLNNDRPFWQKTDPKWPKGLLNRPMSVKTDPIGTVENAGIGRKWGKLNYQLNNSILFNRTSR